MIEFIYRQKQTEKEIVRLLTIAEVYTSDSAIKFSGFSRSNNKGKVSMYTVYAHNPDMTMSMYIVCA